MPDPMQPEELAAILPPPTLSSERLRLARAHAGNLAFYLRSAEGSQARERYYWTSRARDALLDLRACLEEDPQPFRGSGDATGPDQ